MMEGITDNLESLLAVLPSELVEVINDIDRNSELIEIILDLGRVPTSRYVDGEYTLLDREITMVDLDQIVMQIGDFDADNRAGIERTLHRISGIRNRRGEVVGLTLRVGRAVFGTIDIVKDIIEGGKSTLFLGKPGVGKTTMLREAARILADSRRVVIVDTSNEIGGDGDVPHPAVGKSRRMQVPTPNLQHEVMIEAVENHNPEVIIIDEIGRELEAQASRTIAERGVQLIGTAHGITLENLLLNPTLSDLVGGIESVTLSDEEARRRGTQKTVLERRAPPTFDVVIELQDRDTLIVHHDVALAVDMMLRGRQLTPELRRREENGKFTIEAPRPPEPAYLERKAGSSRIRGKNGHEHYDDVVEERAEHRHQENGSDQTIKRPVHLKLVRVYPYGVARNRLVEVSQQFKVPVQVVDSLEEADLLLTLKNFYRRRPRIIADAERRGTPIYVLRSNTSTQMENFAIDYFQLELEGNGNQELQRAIQEAKEGIDAIEGGVQLVDLSPQAPYIRKMQHRLIRNANLLSHSYGKDPKRYVRIYRE
jgi:stage III sporulation protein SpoIIIAA